MLLAGLIILCVAVIIGHAPVPQGGWFAMVLGVIALILICLSGTSRFARVDFKSGRLMSHLDTRRVQTVQQPDTPTHVAVLKSGDARHFVIAAN